MTQLLKTALTTIDDFAVLTTIDDFAVLTSRTKRTIARYLSAGMPHRHLGRRVFIDPEEAQAWIRARGL